MAAPPAANAPTDLSTCEPLDWATDNSKDLEWAWDRFLSRPSHSGEPWTHQQRVLLQNSALYYSNQSVREKGEMQEAARSSRADPGFCIGLSMLRPADGLTIAFPYQCLW
ncbi:unnamed protein product [Ectocarpus sp. CCAP 1310/34]|nr:unnamed protein product [Ectocarpus sp. CCAP 1310/34]